MARSRVYRHHIRFPDYSSNWMRMDGFSNGRQAYRGGDCRRRYVPGGAYRRPGPAVKAQTIAMYSEGGSLSAIGRVLGYSAPAVLGWVKKGGSIFCVGSGNGVSSVRRGERGRVGGSGQR